MYHQYMTQASANIRYLSTDELKELLNDDEKLEERVNEVLKSLEEEKDVILNVNRGLAESNINKEPEIIEKKGRISELSEEGKTLCTSVQEKLAELKTKSGDKTPDTALALLQAASAESEEKSDKQVEQFLSKELAIDEFVEQFMSTRKEMHLRKLKTDKMVDLIRQEAANQRNTGILPSPYSGSSFYPPASGGALPYPSGGVPYPSGPIQMPMPGMMFRQF